MLLATCKQRRKGEMSDSFALLMVFGERLVRNYDTLLPLIQDGVV